MTTEKLAELKLNFNSKVYNAISNVCYEMFEKRVDKLSIEEQKELIDEAFEWFTIHFFDE